MSDSLWPWDSLINAGAQVGSAYIASDAQKEINERNIEMWQHSLNFNAGQAEISREWSADQAHDSRMFQKRMSSTSYQRAMADMQRAGLNPMMAYSQGGAGGAPGAMGTSSAASATAPPHLESEGAAVAQTAKQLPTVLAAIEKTNAETELLRAQARTEENRPENVQADTVQRRQGTATDTERMVHYMAQVNQIGEQNEFIRANVAKVRQEIKNLVTEQEYKAIEVMIGKLTAIHSDLDLIRATNEAKHEAGTMGKVRPWLSDVDRGAHSAKSLVDTFRQRGLTIRR